jgi:hypothetical protein
MTNGLRVLSLQVPILVLFRFLAGALKAAKRFDLASKVTNIVSPAIFLGLVALSAFVCRGLYSTIAARILAQLVPALCLLLYAIPEFLRPNLTLATSLKIIFGSQFHCNGILV